MAFLFIHTILTELSVIFENTELLISLAVNASGSQTIRDKAKPKQSPSDKGREVCKAGEKHQGISSDA